MNDITMGILTIFGCLSAICISTVAVNGICDLVEFIKKTKRRNEIKKRRLTC